VLHDLLVNELNWADMQ